MMRHAIGLATLALFLQQDAWAALPFLPVEVCYHRAAAGGMGVEDVRALPPEAWRACETPRAANLGYTRDEVWARMVFPAVRDDCGACILELPSTRTDYLDWFVFQNNALVKRALSGGMRREPEGLLKTRLPALPLTLQPGETTEVYVRLRSDTAMRVHFRLWGAGAFAGELQRREPRITFLLGGMLMAVVLSFLFVWSTRDWGSIFFPLCFSAFFVAAAALSGWTQNIAWLSCTVRTKTLVLAPITWGMAFLLLHARHFYDLTARRPRLAGWVRGCGCALLGAGVAMFWLPFTVGIRLLHGIIVLTQFAVVLVAVMMHTRKTASWLFLSAYVLYYGYAIVQILFYHGLTPFTVRPELHGVGTFVLSMLLFMVAMTLRIRDIGLERKRLRQEAFEAQREMSVRLEAQVRERTAELEQAKNVAEAANRAKTRFFSQISHDLRAPLNWLIGLSESLSLQSRKLRLTGEFQGYLAQVQKGGAYLDQLLHNILDIHAIEAGQAEVRAKKFSLAEWSGGLETIAQTLAQTGGVRLQWTLDAGPAGDAFCGDVVKLSQILMNLVHNAIRFTPSGKTVEVALRHLAGCLSLDVADEGPGLAEITEKIFEQFHQNRDNPDVRLKGVGLGLHIVKSHVDAMRGTIAWGNRETGGAFFKISAPECAIEEAP